MRKRQPVIPFEPHSAKGCGVLFPRELRVQSRRFGQSGTRGLRGGGEGEDSKSVPAPSAEGEGQEEERGDDEDDGRPRRDAEVVGEVEADCAG